MKQLFFSLLIILLNSCTYKIYISKDGISKVSVHDYITDDKGNQIESGENLNEIFDLYDAFSSNPTITEYKRTKHEISYKVNIDSLGRYLFPFNPDEVDNKFKFEQDEKSFTITETFTGLESGEFDAYMELASTKMFIHFERKISSFKSDFKNVRKINKNTLELIISDREFNYGKGEKTISVIFK